MKKFIVGLILMFSVNSWTQITVSVYNPYGNLSSEEVIEGSVNWNISSDTSSIVFSQIQDHKETQNIKNDILTYVNNNNIYEFLVCAQDGQKRIMIIWKDTSLISYIYEDNSYILMYGNISYSFN